MHGREPEIGQQGGGVVDRVESIAADEGDCVAEDGLADCLRGTEAGAWDHGLFGAFDDEPGVEFDVVGVIVQLAEFEGEMRVVGRDFVECLVLDEIEEEAEFVQGGSLPFPRLFDPEDLNCAENHRDARIKGRYKVNF